MPIESACPMQDIAEGTVLLRGNLALPDDLKLVTVEFQEGWNFVQSGDTHWLDKRIRKCGWHFIRIAEKSLRGGVGENSKAAIAGALKLALRQVSECYKAVGIEHIKLTQYPWFFLAAIRIYPYQIQQSADLSFSVESKSPLMPPHARAAAAAGNRIPPAYSSGM